MKYPIQAIKSLNKILDEVIIPALKTSGATKMLDSRKIKLPEGNEVKFRELFGQCLLSLLEKHFTKENWVPSTDPWGGDGMIYREIDGLGIPIEQVYAIDFDKNIFKPVVDRIKEEMRKKNNKGKEYGNDRMLFIFCDIPGKFKPADLINSPDCSNFPSCSLAVKTSEKLEYAIFTLKEDEKTVAKKFMIQLEKKPYGVFYEETLKK